MKRVLIVANLAGFASFLLSDMDILLRNGYEVTFVANGNVLGWEDTQKVLREKGVIFRQVDFDGKTPLAVQNIKAYFQLYKLLREKKYDLIHCHTPIAGLIVRLAAMKYRKKGTKVVYTTHGFSFAENTSRKTWLIYRTLENILSRISDAIITINKEDFTNAQKMHCKNVYYIHGVGVDTAQYHSVGIDRSAYRQTIGVEDEDIMVLSVGELSDRKNHKVVIDALSLLNDCEKYVYVICGTGVNGGTGKLLEEIAQQKAVRLILLGFRYDIPEITSCSDVGALPSKREGLGLAGIQSLAAGIPVVGTGVQGIKDYVNEGVTGYLCDCDDAEGFARGIQQLATLKGAERERIKECCISMARRFDKKVSNKEMKEIYEEILKRPMA